jgi:hypothetical protein
MRLWLEFILSRGLGIWQYIPSKNCGSHSGALAEWLRRLTRIFLLEAIVLGIKSIRGQEFESLGRRHFFLFLRRFLYFCCNSVCVGMCSTGIIRLCLGFAGLVETIGLVSIRCFLLFPWRGV